MTLNNLKIHHNKLTLAWLTIILSITVYVYTLFFIGYYDSENNSNIGLELVLWGPVFVFAGGASLTWLANPILWLSWAKIRNKRFSFYGSIVSTLISLSFLLFDEVKQVGTRLTTDMHTAGVEGKILGYGIGYYLWVSSSLILLVGNSFRLKNENMQKVTEMSAP